ncbi:giy-yig catalytic domain [Plakobranchus ocellatus]|uniref:Giy-yig catalytic domain n=1 Tax=Plakobranchus ocellatus TaxID=259542 RepID=A0AAV4B6L3_9GAST|nr:giy-yig catalytic domain [Plakobranchus ocellatus]
MDVSALYTNIPHGEGNGACKFDLEKWRDPSSTPSPTFICDRLKLFSRCNCFHDEMWLQIHSTAKSAHVGPSYANLFREELEKNYYYLHLQNRRLGSDTSMTFSS